MLLKIRERATIPTFDAFYTDSMILEALNDELRETVYPDFINLHNGSGIQVVDIPLQLPNGASAFPTGLMPYPKRCYGTMIRKAYFKNSSGNVFDLPLLSDAQIDNYRFINVSSSSTTVQGLFVQNDFIRIVPTQSNNPGFISLRYVIQVPSLVNDPGLFGNITNLQVPGGFNLLPVITTNNFSFLNSYCPINSNNYFDIYRKSTGSILYPDVLLKRRIDSFGNVNFFDVLSPLSNDQIQELTNCQQGGFPINSYTPADLLLMPADQNFFTPINPEIDDYLAVKTGSRLLLAQGNGEEAAQLNDSAKMIWEKIMPLFAQRIKANMITLKPRRGIRAYSLTYNYWR